jgi:hypothetical protein
MTAGHHAAARRQHGVVLATIRLEVWRGGQVVVGTQRHQQDVRLLAAAVGDYLTRRGIDRGDPFLAVGHAGFGDVPVGAAQLVSGPPAKQDLQLGKPEMNESF